VVRTTFFSPLPVARDHLLVRRINGNLPGDEDKSVGPDGLRIGPNRLRSFFGRNHVAHEASRTGGEN
jgi:hypothetical protein